MNNGEEESRDNVASKGTFKSSVRKLKQQQLIARTH